MLTRTRNELLIAGGFALLVLLLGSAYFRMRADRADRGRPLGVPQSDVVPGDGCPLLTSWVASPLQTSVGSWIDVGASAVDADPGETVTYAWKPAPNFAKPDAATTRYRCSDAGQQVLTLEASDDHHPKSCTTRISIPVDCIAR